MSILFEPTEINGLKLPNRFVRSATWEGMATAEGACTPALTAVMARLAEGRVGLIISGHAYVSPEGQAGPRQLGIYRDELIAGLRQMTETVHALQGRIVAQLAHAGYFAKPKLTRQAPWAVSPLEGFSKSPRQILSIEDIERVGEAFGQAARRAREAGFDGVQIHAAHGYLLSQFLSPLFNQRTDAYGGPIENRTRMLIEVIRKVRNRVGPDFPILMKMNSRDHLEGGLSLEDALTAGGLLEKEGLDALEISGGTFLSGELSPSRAGIKGEEKEAYFREAARAFKQRMNLPIILVGGIRSYSTAERLVAEGYADYVSLSRALILEPDLIRRWESGDQRPAFCLSDNLCFKPAMAGEGLYCVVERKIPCPSKVS
jgi:2,4-dienoyl-CoA reductase-like NADH-dependent reductase (Old Yellow Enzyme family)